MDTLDFFQFAIKELKSGGFEAKPDFIVARTKDLMVRAKNFYAIWDENAEGPGQGLWSTDEYDVQRIVDDKLHSYQRENKDVVKVQTMKSFGSNGQSTFRKYMSQIGDNSHQLDEKLTFQGQPVLKTDYVSKRLPYELAAGDISAWDQMVGQLYKPSEREKIEWAIGAIVAGESKNIQKFIVLHGPPGAGKGTIINICMKLFDGYVSTFDAKALGQNGNQFAASAFSSNPLVAIQHDGDLSRIEDNTTLNSIVSHEIMKINEKFKPAYDARINAFLIMGTNKPVKITDAQSGLIRRLIDVHPTNNKIPRNKYDSLMAKIEFELGAIAHHCREVFLRLGKSYYNNYQPLEMMFKTNAFFNFIEAHYEIFEAQGGVSAKQAWTMYKEWAEDALGKDNRMSFYAFKSELGNYFEEFYDRITLDGIQVRSYYKGLKADLYKTPDDEDASKFKLFLEETTSLLDHEYADCAAQYTTASGAPKQTWANVTTTLSQIDTSREHFVLGIPENHVIIDFDIEDKHGEKSLELNLAAAAEWPSTYAEVSRSGKAVHLTYEYDGDLTKVASTYGEGIEIKRYPGNSALRRKLTKCNSVPIAKLKPGQLPFKEKKRVLDEKVVITEHTIRKQIEDNLQKKVHPGTKPSIDFIHHILEEAYESGVEYDVTNLRQKIIIFANNSTNKQLECLRIVSTMKWASQKAPLEPEMMAVSNAVDERLVLWDVEVYPNLFVICWKFKQPDGETPDPKLVTTMINPKPHEVQALLKLKLVGFNNRNYDNHIMWAAAMGYTLEQLYQLSYKIVNNVVGVKFGSAYGISWTDVFDFSTKKQGLKKWQIELGLNHKEMDLPWDKPVPESEWMRIGEYCANDVVSLEHVLNHLSGDYKARLILADLSGLSPNDTTAKHTAAIVFGREKNPQRDFVYTDLRKEFPGYEFITETGKPVRSEYRGEVVGEGGYVYAEPGVYQNVVLLDVASMHPTSIGRLNLFGEHTPRFMALVEAQLAIKKRDFATAKTLLGGKLKPYVEEIETLQETDPKAAKKAAFDLRWGLKIAINIVYGLTSAKFDNPFKDRRNVDNIVAKRGALFMINLKGYIQDVLKKKVVHVKTDSVKVPDATADDIRKITEFGANYGYAFEHEATYEKFGLVNEAVYVAKSAPAFEKYNPETGEMVLTSSEKEGWSATGKQYSADYSPYVYKTLFKGGEDINFFDLCETKHVQQGALYLDFGVHGDNPSFNADNPLGWVDAALLDIKLTEKAFKAASKAADFDGDPATTAAAAEGLIAQENYKVALEKLIFVGKTGRFTPVLPGYGGGQLYRIKDGKHYAVQGTKGRLWVESTLAVDLPGDAIDYTYFEELVEDAKANLAQFTGGAGYSSVEEFLQ